MAEVIVHEAEPVEVEHVILSCTLCSWRSEPSPVLDEPNAVWWAKARVVQSYRDHHQRSHRPLPVVHHFGGTGG